MSDFDQLAVATATIDSHGGACGFGGVLTSEMTAEGVNPQQLLMSGLDRNSGIARRLKMSLPFVRGTQ